MLEITEYMKHDSNSLQMMFFLAKDEVTRYSRIRAVLDSKERIQQKLDELDSYIVQRSTELAVAKSERIAENITFLLKRYLELRQQFYVCLEDDESRRYEISKITQLIEGELTEKIKRIYIALGAKGCRI